MLARGASKYSHLSHFYFSSFDSDGKTLDQCRCHLLSCFINNPAEGLPRHAHPLRRLLLVKSLVVGEAYRLKLVHRDVHLSNGASGRPGRFEQPVPRLSGNSSAAFWSSHDVSHNWTVPLWRSILTRSASEKRTCVHSRSLRVGVLAFCPKWRCSTCNYGHMTIKVKADTQEFPDFLAGRKHIPASELDLPTPWE